MFDERVKKYFLMIARERSISKAAQKLFISQPSLSKFLSTLEKDIGATLFDRTRAPLGMTTAGEHFLEYIERAERLHLNYLHQIANVDYTAPKGVLRLGIGPWRSGFFLTNVYPDFNSKYPNVEIILQEEVNQQMRSQLMKNQIDVAIVASTTINDASQPTLLNEFLFAEKLLILVSKNHPIASLVDFNTNSPRNPALLDLRMIEGQRIISGKPGQRLSDDIGAIITKWNLSVAGIISTVNISSAIAMARYNMGLAFIPQSYLFGTENLGNLVFFYSDDPILTWLVSAEYNGHNPTIAEKYLVSLMRESVVKLL